jgi:plasmid replication initiation protein
MSRINDLNRGIKLIRKSNKLIEARYNFDIWESRLFSKVLTLVRPTDNDFNVFRIYLRDVIEDFDLHKDNASYNYLRKAADSLMNKKFYIPYEVDGVLRERKYPIIIMSDSMKKVKNESSRKAQEYIDLSVHPDMRPLLLELREKYTSYDLRNIKQLRSNYTLRIYEHLKQYEKIGKRTLEIQYLKRVFEIENEYPLFANFYQKIIEPALRDINIYTDIEVSKVDKLKRGRKVVSLQFFIHRKSDVKIKEIFGIEELIVPESEELAEYEEIAGVMKNERDQMYLKFESILVADFGISPIAFGEVIEKYGEKEIQKAIRVTKRAKSNGQISKNMAGFFLKAIKENYTDEAESKKEKSEKIAFDKQLKIKQLEGNLNQLTKDHTKEINKIVKGLTENNPEITTAAIKTLREMPLTQILIKERESNLGRTLILQDFKEDKTLVDLVIGQIITQNNEHFTEMMSEFNSLSNKLRKAINQLKEI